jgi:hypothetical protein
MTDPRGEAHSEGRLFALVLLSLPGGLWCAAGFGGWIAVATHEHHHADHPLIVALVHEAAEKATIYGIGTVLFLFILVLLLWRVSRAN